MRTLFVLLAVAACTNSGSLKFDREGRVLISNSMLGGSPSAGASAVFTGGSVWGTVIAADGSCIAYMGSASDTSSAGAIMITGTESPITLMPTGTAPDVMYQSVGMQNGTFFQAGAAITAQAAGAQGATDVAAFTLTTTAPAAVTGFSPPGTISRSGFTTTWTQGDGSHMWILVFGFDPQAGSAVEVICDANDLGSFTVPATTFTLLPVADTQVIVGVARVHDSSRVLSDTRVELDVLTVSLAGPLTLGP